MNPSAVLSQVYVFVDIVVSLIASVIVILMTVLCFFFFKQKTAYEMRISDWSSDVCSSDLRCHSSRCAGMLRRQAPRTLVPHYRLFSSRCRRGIEAMLCVTGRDRKSTRLNSSH